MPKRRKRVRTPRPLAVAGEIIVPAIVAPWEVEMLVPALRATAFTQFPGRQEKSHAEAK